MYSAYSAAALLFSEHLVVVFKSYAVVRPIEFVSMLIFVVFVVLLVLDGLTDLAVGRSWVVFAQRLPAGAGAALFCVHGTFYRLRG